jgi:hypothetical protein
MRRVVQRDLALRPTLDRSRGLAALDRLAREKALHSIVRWALPLSALKPLLGATMPRRLSRDMPPEAWAGVAVSLAREVEPFAVVLAEALHERLGWDREPPTLEEFERLCRERPLEGLWVGATAEGKTLRKAYPRLAAQCLKDYRSSPDCPPASWDYVEAIIQVHAGAVRDLERAEDQAERAARERDAERQRLEGLREELKRLRRENAELRGEKAEAERKAQALAQRARAAAEADEGRRIEELERRLRKADKEREHLERELERRRADPAVVEPSPTTGEGPVEAPPVPAERPDPGHGMGSPIAEDPNPRRRVLRQMLRRLVKKGKIGGSHTHEDNVHRGVADHDKGDAKQGIELLVAEGHLFRKTSTWEPHVAVNPERLAEVRAIIRGEVSNPRLVRFVEGKGARPSGQSEERSPTGKG